MTVRALFIMILITVFMPANSPSLGVGPAPQDGNRDAITTQRPSGSAQPFKTRFISLTRGHAIAPSYLTFGDKEEFAIQTPGEDFLQAKGSYTKNTFFFTAHFRATLLKQEKQYQYTFTIKGISLLENYIAGVLVLNETIRETAQAQEVTFIFLGAPEEAVSPKKKERGLFPF